MNLQRVQDRLSLTLLITGVGTWLTYFALLIWAYQLTNNILLSTGTFVFRGIGATLGGAITPYLNRRYDLRSLLVYSQAICVLTMTAILLIVLFTDSYTGFYVALGINLSNSVFNQIFTITRESYSLHIKNLQDTQPRHSASESLDHNQIQSLLERAVSAAQFFGPALAVGLYFLAPSSMIWISIALDILSFGVAGLICSRMPPDLQYAKSSGHRSTTATLIKNQVVRDVILVKAFLFAPPIVLASMFIFPAFKEISGMPIIITAISYVVVAIGKTYGSHWMLKKKNLNRPVWFLAGSLGMALAYIIPLQTYVWPFIVLVVSRILVGFFNTIQIVTCRSVLKEGLNKEDNPTRIISFDQALSQTVTILTWAIANWMKPSWTNGFYACGVLFCIAGIVFFFRVRHAGLR